MKFQESIAELTRDKEAKYGNGSGGLNGEICPKCKTIKFPPRGNCLDCHSKTEKYSLTGKGKIHSFSIVYPYQFGDHWTYPFAVGIIELEEKVKITARITDINLPDIKIDMLVEMVIRKLKENYDSNIITYCYAFRPILPKTSLNLQNLLK